MTRRRFSRQEVLERRSFLVAALITIVVVVILTPIRSVGNAQLFFLAFGCNTFAYYIVLAVMNHRDSTNRRGNRYTVWVGGTEIIDHFVAQNKAKAIAQVWIEKGYEDVAIVKIDERNNTATARRGQQRPRADTQNQTEK